MNKLKKSLTVIITLLVLLLIILTKAVYGTNTKEIEYSKEYKNWLELSDEEKEKVMQPRMYDVIPINEIPDNLLYKVKLLGASANSRYSLKDVIPDNLSIRNQQQTPSCWAFAALSSLETNLAMNNYKKGLSTPKIYDYSERHMEYATSRFFLNDKINPIGYNRTAGDGGILAWATSYLTNGSGAVLEKDMPFENNKDIIDIEQIQNKKVATQVYETIEFPDYNDNFYVKEEDRPKVINQIKTHIQNYGAVGGQIKSGIFAGINFDISNQTGALALSGGFADHAVSIVGWDDNFSIENWNEFDEEKRPSKPGAWIARNSWGEESGKDGFIYVSYEDYHISQNLSGIIRASDEIEYDHLYQYDYYYPNKNTFFLGGKGMLCNIFDKESNNLEYLTEVQVYIPTACVCKVYVNPTGNEKDKDSLKMVSLKSGENEIVDKTGYHTIEFAEPIEITSEQFAVAIEFEPIDEEKGADLSLVEKGYSKEYDYVTLNPGKCFILESFGYKGDDNNYNSIYDYDWSQWQDLSEKNRISTIKAFTTNTLNDNSLKNIEIVTPPTKTHYFEGENFDKTGMVVKANYNSKTKPYIILDNGSYNITDGNNLKVNQTNVTITYEDKSVNQAITVEKNSVTELKIKKSPVKTEYKEGQDFDKNGMVVEATFKDGTKKEITDYTIENGNNLKANQTYVTITYGEKTIQKKITVIQNKLMEIKVTKEPNKTKYVIGQNFDKTGMIITGTYQDKSTQEIKDYTIENGTNLVKDQSSVIIKYEEKTVEQPITVEEKIVTEIEIDKMPSKTKYIQNRENLDLTGGTIKVKYNDDSIEEIALTSDSIKISGFDNTKVGKNTITIQYETKTISLDLEIVAEVKPINSNFDNSYCKVENVKYYTYTNSNKQEYLLMDITVDKIIKNEINDSYEYYYYLSSNQNEKNIENWVKISEVNNSSNDKIMFKIDTRDMKNYSELSTSNNLYIYIKEVAIKGSNQSVKVSNAMELDSEVNIETYVNDAKINKSNSNNKVLDTNNNKEDSDNTKAPGVLPKTGKICIIMIFVISSFIGVTFFIRYKNLSKYIK